MSALPTLADESDTADATAEVQKCQATALGISENLEACEAALDSNKRLCDARLKLKVEAAKSAGEIKLQGAEERIKVLTSALEAAEERADREVWEHPAWWVAGGLVVGAVVATAAVYGSVWAVGQLRPAIPPVQSTE